MKTSAYTNKFSVKKFIISAIIASSAAMFNGCKKGDGDPILSFKSRKARVEGEWKVTSYEEKTTSSGSSGTTTFTSSFNGTSWVDTYSSPGGSSSQTSSATYTFTFTKDGKYTLKRTITSSSGSLSVWEQEGLWDFLTGVGELKNKEYIALTKTREINSPGSSGVFEGQNYSAWQITTLKNKEMVLHIEEESASSSGSSSSTGTTTIDITLTQ